MRKGFAALALTLLVAGCGGSSSTTSNSGAGPGSTAGQDTSSSPTRATETNGSSAEQSTQSSSSGSSSSPPPDKSIQTYGSAAADGEKAAISATAFAFFKAMAASEYAKLCTGISASIRAQLEAFDKAEHEELTCAALLKTLISSRGVPEARRAAAGALTSVRVKGSTAIVVFKPRGEVPSYFVLKREAGSWKAIALTPGTPLNPVAGLGR